NPLFFGAPILLIYRSLALHARVSSSKDHTSLAMVSRISAASFSVAVGLDLHVFAAIVGGQRVTVRAEEAQIFEAVIAPVAVDVIEFERNRLVEPFGQAAADALMGEITFFDEANFQAICTAVGRIFNENTFHTLLRVTYETLFSFRPPLTSEMR